MHQLRHRFASSRAAAACFALLLVAPVGALPAGSALAPSVVVSLSHSEFPLGSWRMFHANPEHTGEGDTTLPPMGHVVWSYRANASDKPEGGAAVDAGIVYVGLGSSMMAFNATSGARLWSHGAFARIFSTPALVSGVLYFGAEGAFGSPNFFAIDASTGGRIWSANETPDLGGGIQFVHSSPTVVGGLVYYGSYSYWLYARDAVNGSAAWSANLSSEVVASPAHAGEIVYAASAGIHNPVTPSWDVAPRLWAFNATTGQDLWNQTVTQGHLLASPVVAGGVVYAATAGFSYFTADVDSGYVLAFDALTGAPLWTSPDVGRMTATPAVYGSVMYVAGAGEQAGGLTNTGARLRWLDLSANGAVLGEQPVGDDAPMDSSPAAVAGRVVAAARDGAVSLFLASGALLWSYDLPAEVIAPLAVASEMIFVPALDGYLYAFGAQPDFAVDPTDMVLSDLTPHRDQPLTLRVTVHNRGDKKGSGQATAEVNQSGAVTPIAMWNLTDLDKFSQISLSAPVRFGPEGEANITVSITAVTPADGDLLNNNATATYSVLPPLGGWAARYGDARGTNFLETDTPQNNILLWKQDALDVQGGGFIAYGQTLVFSDSSNRVVAVPRARGNDTVSWTWDAPAALVGSPTLANGLILVATSDPADPAGNVTFIDPDTGGAVRTVALTGRPTTSGIPFGDAVFFGMTDRLVELSVASLGVERELPTIGVPPASQPALRTEPVVQPGWVFVISSVGELHAFNLTTASEPPGWPVQLGASTDVPPLAGQSFLYAVTGPTDVSAFSLAPLAPTPVWNATLDSRVTGAMALAYGRLFIPTESNVTALLAGSGAQVWNRSLSPAQLGNAIRAAGNNTVYAGSERLFAISATTGDIEWEYEPGPLGEFRSSAALLGGTLHLQTDAGTIVTLGLITGRPPTACFDSPIAGRTYRTREPVNFSSACTFDPDNEPLAFSWDFGDGNNSTAASEFHTYGFPGDFRVRLTVTDGLMLSSTRTIDLHLIENQAPTVYVPQEDRPQPDITGKHHDNTIWTFKVRYLDPDGDPPAGIAMNISNETDGLKPLLPVSNVTFNFTEGVDYYWTGALSSGRHTYTFEASDGLDTAISSVFGPFNIFRIETRDAPQLSYMVEYVGKGISSLTPVTGLIPPPGFGPIDKFSITLPPDASLVTWIRIEFRYGLAVDLSEFDEFSIGLYVFENTTKAWAIQTSVIRDENDTLITNVSGPSVFAAQPEGLRAIFGVFGHPTVPPLAPIAVFSTTGDRTIFAPGEPIEFSAADSVERNDGNMSNLSFFWQFGDGSEGASGVLVNHTFNTTGSYDVVLTVFNAFGQNHTVRKTVTVRTEASTSAFLGIAAVIVGALFFVALLWPVFRRRARIGSAGAPGSRMPEKEESSRDSDKRAAVPGAPPRLDARAPSDEEAEVVDELEAEFEGRGPRGGPG